MASTIRIKRSNVAGNKPSTSDIEMGEIALNTKDQKLYSSNGSVIFEMANAGALANTNSYIATVDAQRASDLANTNARIDGIGGSTFSSTTATIGSLNYDDTVVTSISGGGEVSNATFQSALANTNSYIATKADIASPTFTGNVGIGTSPSAQLNLSAPNNIGGSGGTLTNAALRIGTAAASMYFDTNEIHGGETLNFFSNGTDSSIGDYIRFSTGGSGGGERLRIDSSGRVLINTTAAIAGQQLRVHGNAGSGTIGIAAATNFNSQIQFGDPSSSSAGQLIYAHNGDSMRFHTNGSEQVRITNVGRVGVNNTSPVGPFEVLDANIAGSSGEDGFYISTTGQIGQSTDNAAAFYMNDSSSSAGTHNYIIFRYQGTTIGDIDTTDNSTIRYNTFTGAHWSQWSDNSQPDIPLGTVMSTINEMCNHTQFEYIDEEGETQNIDIAGSFEIGSTHTIYIDEDGAQAECTAISQSTHKRLAKVKVSDTAGDKSVYGVFAGHYKDGDSSIESLGLGAIRIGSGVTVENGDLLESAGDGTARPQTGDTADLFKASTIAKVTSTVVIETYDDGSFTVPCTLHCG